jgi:hypothetical protein
MPNPQTLLALATSVLILKVTASIVLSYGDYFPPDFSADFLRGREAYFHGPYQAAFYAHILVGPLTLVLGLALVSEAFRQRFPRWHRQLGKAQGMLVLLVLAPSGLWMSGYAATGPMAGAAFAAQSLAVAACVLIGWRLAMRRRFPEHRTWMWRCFLLLCSAVTLRLIGGAVSVAEIANPWSYALAAWASWLVPLGVFELARWLSLRRASASAPARRLEGDGASSAKRWLLKLRVVAARDGDERPTLFGREFRGQ